MSKPLKFLPSFVEQAKKVKKIFDEDTPLRIDDTELSPSQAKTWVFNMVDKYSLDDARRWRRYKILDDFIKGNHWSSDEHYGGHLDDYDIRYSENRPAGMAQITFNKCGAISKKFVQFLSVHQLQPHVPKPVTFDDELETPEENAQDPTKEDARALLADTVEKVGRSVMFDDNDGKRVLKQWAKYCSDYGDGIIRSVYDPIQKKIVKSTVNPMQVTAWFKDNSYTEFAGVIERRKMDYSQAMLKPEQGGYNHEGKLDTASLVDFQSSPKSMVQDKDKKSDIWVFDAWIDLSEVKSNGEMKYRCRNIIVVGGITVKDEIVKEPFPYYHARFQDMLNTGWGEGSVNQVLPLQRELNEAMSDEREIVKTYSAPWIIDEDSGQDLSNIMGNVQGAKHVPINSGGKLYFLEWSGQIYPIHQHIDRLERALDDIGSMPKIAYGAIDASLATGVALTTSFQSTIQMIKDWSQNMESALSRMWRDDLIRLEQYEPNAKNLIQGHYKVKWEWGERAPRDESLFITNVINQKNAGMLSDETAMEKLGVPSPIDEKMQIAREKNNPFYNPELALQKAQSYMQWKQISQQMAPQQPQQPQGPQDIGPGGIEGVAAPGQGRPEQSEVPNLTPNLQNVAQPFAQPGVGGGSNQQPQQTEGGI